MDQTLFCAYSVGTGGDHHNEWSEVGYAFTDGIYKFFGSYRLSTNVEFCAEINEMNRLKAAIMRQYEDDADFHIEVHNPRNTESVELHFRGEKTAKVVGKMAMSAPKDGEMLGGVLVRRNFNYHLMRAHNLSAYTGLSNSVLIQKESIYYNGSTSLLLHNLQQVSGHVILKHIGSKDPSNPTHHIPVFSESVRENVYFAQHITIIEWTSNPVNDMFADRTLVAVLHAQANPIPDKRELCLICFMFYGCYHSNIFGKNAMKWIFSNSGAIFGH
uniref:Pre-mRNA 3'-end-processing endonuclease polyadenylation factor C-term domain-containing protein n=2 Tax=Parascaris univalens TaxID=6257 RepID=A0A915A5Q5_PARUN